MAKHQFKYYLHDSYQSDEREDEIQRQMPAGVTVDGEKLGRPFYEVTLLCTYDDATGGVEVVSVEL